MSLAEQVKNYIIAAGVAISEVSIANNVDKSTWKVFPANLQAAAAPHITSFVAFTPAQELDDFSQKASRQKDLLATLAVIVRAKNVVAWSAMTIQQKVDATLAEADVWKAIRIFIDDKV